jgi:hypothetical protein
METETFTDPAVQARLAAFVPLKIDIASTQADQAAELMRRGWPYLAVRDVDGVERATFHGPQDGARLAQRLEAATPAGGSAPPWTRIHELASLAERAREDEAAGRFAAAHDAYAALAQAEVDAFRRAGEDGRTRIADLALDAILRARERAPEDAEGARGALREARERFTGTPFATDLGAVLEGWPPGAPFPPLSEIPR